MWLKWSKIPELKNPSTARKKGREEGGLEGGRKEKKLVKAVNILKY
jgi:hypothetical protein